jgi:predicted porin
MPQYLDHASAHPAPAASQRRGDRETCARELGGEVRPFALFGGMRETRGDTGASWAIGGGTSAPWAAEGGLNIDGSKQDQRGRWA